MSVSIVPVGWLDNGTIIQLFLRQELRLFMLQRVEDNVDAITFGFLQRSLLLLRLGAQILHSLLILFPFAP